MSFLDTIVRNSYVSTNVWQHENPFTWKQTSFSLSNWP